MIISKLRLKFTVYRKKRVFWKYLHNKKKKNKKNNYSHVYKYHIIICKSVNL